MWSCGRLFLRPRAFPLLKSAENGCFINKYKLSGHRTLAVTSSHLMQSNYLSPGLARGKNHQYELNSSILTTYGAHRHFSFGASNEGSSPKPSLYQRFKTMYKDYWYVLIPVHVVTSCVWFGAFFYTARSGFDIAGAIEVLNLSDEIMDKIRTSANSTAGHITLAYLLYKVFTPLRYTVTLGGTTYAIKALTARGLLKKMPKKEELKQMMVDKKESLRDKKDNLAKELAGKFSASKKNMLPPLQQQKAQ